MKIDEEKFSGYVSRLIDLTKAQELLWRQSSQTVFTCTRQSGAEAATITIQKAKGKVSSGTNGTIAAFMASINAVYILEVVNLQSSDAVIEVRSDAVTNDKLSGALRALYDCVEISQSKDMFDFLDKILGDS